MNAADHAGRNGLPSESSNVVRPIDAVVIQANAPEFTHESGEGILGLLPFSVIEACEFGQTLAGDLVGECAHRSLSQYGRTEKHVGQIVATTG
jgi:hypothetical protein